jgi:hypothetical protein
MSTLSISKFRAGLFAAVLAVAPLSPALHGQDVGMIAKMNVPFAFETASGHHFAPGVYSVRMDSLHTLLIRGDSDSALTMTTVEDTGQTAKTGNATFRKYGNQYFLAEITKKPSDSLRQVEGRRPGADRRRENPADQRGTSPVGSNTLELSAAGPWILRNPRFVKARLLEGSRAGF